MPLRLMWSFKPTVQTFGQIFVVGVWETMLFISWNIASLPEIFFHFNPVIYFSVVKLHFRAWFISCKSTEKQESKHGSFYEDCRKFGGGELFSFLLLWPFSAQLVVAQSKSRVTLMREDMLSYISVSFIIKTVSSQPKCECSLRYSLLQKHGLCPNSVSNCKGLNYNCTQNGSLITEG